MLEAEKKVLTDIKNNIDKRTFYITEIKDYVKFYLNLVEKLKKKNVLDVFAKNNNLNFTELKKTFRINKQDYTKIQCFSLAVLKDNITKILGEKLTNNYYYLRKEIYTLLKGIHPYTYASKKLNISVAQLSRTLDLSTNTLSSRIYALEVDQKEESIEKLSFLLQEKFKPKTSKKKVVEDKTHKKELFSLKPEEKYIFDDPVEDDYNKMWVNYLLKKQEFFKGHVLHKLNEEQIEKIKDNSKDKNIWFFKYYIYSQLSPEIEKILGEKLTKKYYNDYKYIRVNNFKIHPYMLLKKEYNTTYKDLTEALGLKSKNPLIIERHSLRFKIPTIKQYEKLRVCVNILKHTKLEGCIDKENPSVPGSFKPLMVESNLAPTNEVISLLEKQNSVLNKKLDNMNKVLKTLENSQKNVTIEFNENSFTIKSNMNFEDLNKMYELYKKYLNNKK